jgi:hypothetical protein
MFDIHLAQSNFDILQRICQKCLASPSVDYGNNKTSLLFFDRWLTEENHVAQIVLLLLNNDLDGL